MVATISRAEAAGELIRRRAARSHLLAFTQYTYPDYHPEPFHALVAQHLDAVVNGDLHRLMIFAPPQHGKSEMATVRLPPFWLGRRPNEPVAIVTYGAELAEPMSRRARMVVESEEYRALFPGVTTNRSSRAVGHWELAAPHRGFVHAVGIDGGVIGHGFGLVVLDDPHKDFAAVMSETQRKGVIDYWRNVLRTRLRQGGAVVIMNTRWHMADLCGTLLDEQPGEWTVLRLPALAETQDERDQRNVRATLPIGVPDPLGRQPGEALAPHRYSAETLETIKRDVGSLAWAAQYQGAPTAAEGNMFKRHWFRIVDAPPRRVSARVRYWDKAGTSGAGARTAGVLMSLSGEMGLEERLTVEHVGKGQWSIGQRNRIMRETAQMDRERFGRFTTQEPDIWVEQEPGSGGKESALLTVADLRGFTARAELASGDKEVRAQPLAAYAEAFGIDLVRGPWNQDYIDEMCEFPTGTFKDQVDASSGAFNKLKRGGAWSRNYTGKKENG